MKKSPNSKDTYAMQDNTEHKMEESSEELKEPRGRPESEGRLK